MKNNPYTYGGGSKVSQAYTVGVQGKPCPPRCKEKTSHAYKAWLAGRKVWEQNKKEQPNA